jgi:hypothetical protein
MILHPRKEDPMHHKKLYAIFISLGAMFVIVSVIALANVQPAYAQCGSQASSCKNCHEVQGLDPVNSDGTAWHQSHAFGDFCYICHAGNNQAADPSAAHTAMVSPLADVQASCQQCHPNDLQARAEVYASALGQEIGMAAEPTAATASTPAPVEGAPAPGPEPLELQQAGVMPGDPNLVDYVDRYNEDVLGQEPTNWGNLILIAMIAAMTLGGGYLVVHREGLVRISIKDMRPVGDEFPADVVEMVPGIARLKPAARRSLRRLLDKPEATSEILTSIDKLTHENSPEKHD